MLSFINWFKFLFLLILLLALPVWSAASRFATWIPLTFTGSHEAYLYELQPQLRLNEEHGVDQTLMNLGIGLDFGSWSPWIGITYSRNALDDTTNLQEYRLWEQILWATDNPNINWQSRTRLEQRKALNYSQISNRLRQRLTLRIPMRETLQFVLSDEFFINFNRVIWVSTDVIDQNRAYVGLEHTFNFGYEFQLGAGYMNQYVFSSPNRTDQILLLSATVSFS